MANAVILYRPVDRNELALIEGAEFRAFPPRLPEQPIFYPVTSEAYAVKIARDWNTRYGSGEEFVTRFAVKEEFLSRFKRKLAGGRDYEEYWIPAEQLNEFNDNIVGPIEVIASFVANDVGRGR